MAVRITIPCHRCSEPKRALSPCEACGMPADTESDVSAWRLALHAHHMARITARPFASPAQGNAVNLVRRLHHRTVGKRMR